MDTQALLDELVRRMESALGGELVSVVLYGSAAAGDYQEKVSDLNVLCVLEQAGPDQLERAYDAVDWWLRKKQPAPVLLSREELLNAHDAFAIEFLDIRSAYRILHGEDVVAGITIDPAHHRHQVEHELRARLLRLRERYLALQRDRQEVITLMADSLPTFATLLRHAVLLGGGAPGAKKREVFQKAAEQIGISAEPFETILEIREKKRRLADAEIRSLFARYLGEISRAARYVDQITHSAGGAAE